MKKLLINGTVEIDGKKYILENFVIENIDEVKKDNKSNFYNDMKNLENSFEKIFNQCSYMLNKSTKIKVIMNYLYNNVRRLMNMVLLIHQSNISFLNKNKEKYSEISTLQNKMNEFSETYINYYEDILKYIDNENELNNYYLKLISQYKNIYDYLCDINNN